MVKYYHGEVRTALKASIAVVHRLMSQLPFFIPVNQAGRGLKRLTQPREEGTHQSDAAEEVEEVEGET